MKNMQSFSDNKKAVKYWKNTHDNYMYYDLNTKLFYVGFFDEIKKQFPNYTLYLQETECALKVAGISDHNVRLLMSNCK